MRFIIVFIALLPSVVLANPTPREGWVVAPTAHSYQRLIDRVKKAAKRHDMAVVTEAGPTEAAAARGVKIPGNRIIGIYNNSFAVRMLEASEAAMIEAPVRFYVTEQADGTATLSWKTPSFVFGPYTEDGPNVVTIAAELDSIFAEIGAEAAQ